MKKMMMKEAVKEFTEAVKAAKTKAAKTAVISRLLDIGRPLTAKEVDDLIRFSQPPFTWETVGEGLEMMGVTVIWNPVCRHGAPHVPTREEVEAKILEAVSRGEDSFGGKKLLVSRVTVYHSFEGGVCDRGLLPPSALWHETLALWGYTPKKVSWEDDKIVVSFQRDEWFDGASVVI